MNKKFYLIDDKGRKRTYLGKVIENPDGSFCGFDIKVKNENVKKELTYHPEIKQVDGYYSYFSYINSDGEEVTYYGNPRKDENGSYYITYNSTTRLDLEYHPKVEPKAEYYTYIDKEGNEQIYEGPVVYNKRKNTYYGEL